MFQTYEPYTISEYLRPGDKSLAWTKEFALQLYDRFLSQIPTRLSCLASASQVQLGDNADAVAVREVLKRLSKCLADPSQALLVETCHGDVVVDTSKGPVVVEHAGDRRLSALGLAACIDAATLVCVFAAAKRPEIRWQLYRTKKREVAANLPVIAGYNPVDHYCPIYAGVVAGSGIVRDPTRSDSTWLKQLNTIGV